MPRFRIQHQKNFGSDRDWWWRTEAFGQLLTQEINMNNRTEEQIRYRYFEFENQVNRNITSMASYAGLNLSYQNTDLTPRISPESGDPSLKLKSYSFNVIQIGAHYVYNTLNSAAFATEGATLKGNIARSVNNTINVGFTDGSIPNEIGAISNYTKFGFDSEKRFSLNSKFTGILGLAGNFIIVDAENIKDVSFNDFGLAAKYSLGGNQLSPRRDSFILPGLQEGELPVSQFTKLNLGLQYNFKTKLYVTPHVDVAIVGFGNFENYIKNMVPAKGQWQDFNDVSFLLSSGITLGYDSILGPVTFDVSWVNDLDKIRFFFGVGFPLNRSN